ncbi:zinc finger protein 143-like isoform X2 [Actinia tenebrosa]|uniref:Zinc finger protein 143-like isoform X2 n=1 Tax=Actinia tenebrosa TaxID=6105 RepID=A0A6P8I6K0_ACTTE|nr:zinc finger protein 143-like isoform X2 [Actinia tenebrosa]
MDNDEGADMDVDRSAEDRTALVELSSSTEKDQEDSSSNCSSNIIQIRSDAFIKEKPSEKDIEDEDPNCITSIEDRDGEQCIDSNALLESRGSSCDANVYGRLYLGDNGSQVIFYNSAVSECSSENMEHASESDKNSVIDSNPSEGELVVEDNKKPSPSHSKHASKSSSAEKSYICPVEGCGRNFTSSGHLKYHHSTHSGEKPFKCQHPGCERMFAWPAHLKYHLKTHSGDRPFKCTFEGCGKTFYVLQRLNVHLRVHTGERPYTCKVENCMKSFTTAGNLKNHMRIHTGERPYVCPFVTCGRSFTEHSSLRKHKLRHTGEKPYLCEICGKCFSQSGSRNAHEKRHALESPPRFKGSASISVVHKDEELDESQQDSHSVDSGEEHETNLIYSSDMGCKISTSDQAILAQPIVAKEVSIETTPVQSLQTVVQNVAEELISNQQVLPHSSACVVSLAETVVAQQALIQSMLDGTAVVPVTQSGSSDELTVVDHTLHQEVEQIMQSVVSHHILGSQIQLPISGDDETHEQGTLTVEVPTYMVHSHSQNVLLDQEHEDINSLENDERTMIVTTESNEEILQ